MHSCVLGVPDRTSGSPWPGCWSSERQCDDYDSRLIAVEVTHRPTINLNLVDWFDWQTRRAGEFCRTPPIRAQFHLACSHEQ